MSRINTNITSIRAINSLNATTADMNIRLARLSTGLKINAAKDGPAALIASETLRAEMAGIAQAIDNSERANSVISTAEGALNEVNALLLDIKSLVNNSANEGAIAPEEIEANQLQIDSAIASINRIANSTAFEGVKLLNGSLDFTKTGVTATELKDLQIDEVRFGTASSLSMTVKTNTIAEVGELWWVGAALASDTTIEVAGKKGVEVFTFAAGTSQADLVSAVNQASDVTGVAAVTSADIDGGATSGVIFSSQKYGTKQFVSIDVLSGTFATVLNDGSTASRRDAGVNAEVSVNGVTAVADGLDIQINGPTVSMQATIDTSINVADATSTFTITGGGAQFQLGPEVNAQQMSIVGIQSAAAHRLGNSTDGHLRDVVTGGTTSIIEGSYQSADKIVTDAIQQVAKLRGRLGAFQLNTLQTNINSLNVALENVTASESAIRDADFARETAALTRAQILVQAGTSVLSIANTSPQNVLALLG